MRINEEQGCLLLRIIGAFDVEEDKGHLLLRINGAFDAEEDKGHLPMRIDGAFDLEEDKGRHKKQNKTNSCCSNTLHVPTYKVSGLTNHYLCLELRFLPNSQESLHDLPRGHIMNIILLGGHLSKYPC